jgi:polysaccharide biosynthesis/export protein
MDTTAMDRHTIPPMNKAESMNYFRIFGRASCFFSVLVLAVCASSLKSQRMTSPTSSAITPAAPEQGLDLASAPFILSPGDLISIQVFSTPELSGSARVDQDGYVGLVLGPRLKVKGLTTEQAARAIEQLLKADQIMLDPHVTVIVSQYATLGITVLGEVQRPGTFPMFGPHSLYDALALAGGPSANQGSQITIAHLSDPDHPFQVDVVSANYSAQQKDTPVYPGDTIVVSKAALIYVVGDAMHPGPIPIVNGKPLSLLNVLSICSGLTLTAAGSHASIIRQIGDRINTIPVNLDDILKQKQPNLVMQAEDILVIPRSGRKAFLQLALPAVTNSAVSAAASAAIIR